MPSRTLRLAWLKFVKPRAATFSQVLCVHGILMDGLRDISSARDKRGHWLVALITFAFLISPIQQIHAADGGSYIVSETIESYETVEYEISEPSLSAPSFAWTPQASLGDYGPFRVISEDTVYMSGTVDSYSPDQFRQMLINHPGINRIEMIDCDGSVDEEANLNLARQIRRAGISTHVPATGSIRSGAVELFLAGVTHTADEGAEFIVHSWMDEDGLEANDYPASDPVHKEYLGYYAEMGIPMEKARAFYKLTNSVPFSSQLKLSRGDLARFQLLH